MKSILTRLGAFLVTLGVASSLLVVVAQPASAATKCESWQNFKKCVTIGSAKPSKFIVGYKDSITNTKNYAISGSCTATTSKTVKFSVSSSVSSSADLVFATFDLTVSYNIEKSMSSGYSTSASFRIYPHDTVYCTRGVLKRYRAGKIVYTRWGGAKDTVWFTTGAPSVRNWRIS